MQFVPVLVMTLGLSVGTDERGGEATAVPLPPRHSRAAALGSQTERGIDWTRTLGATVLVAALVVTGLRLTKRWVPAAGADMVEGIRVRQQVALGPRGTLYLVQCGTRLLLVGATGSQLVTLAEIADPDEVATLVRSGREATARVESGDDAAPRNEPAPLSA